MAIKRALISVSDKRGIVEFARVLAKNGVKILSTDGTAKVLKEAHVKVEEVSNYTGFPEIMDGRVKTLHPKIHGGLLALRDNKKHLSEADKNGIKMIDLVVVNLYPFEETMKKLRKKSGASGELADTANELSAKIESEIIENIDIGGPSMIRSAAKNYEFVIVVTDPADYKKIAKMISADAVAGSGANGSAASDVSGNTGGAVCSGDGDVQTDSDVVGISDGVISGIDLSTRKQLARKAFTLTSHYDEAIDRYFRETLNEPELLNLHYEKICSLRYGENPQQKAAFFRNPENHDANITNSKVLHGKQLSFNNLVDGDSALELVKEFKEPTAVFVKHNNPCGVASAKAIEEAFIQAYQADPLSAFGCIIAVNREVNEKIVDHVKANKMFVEMIVAPSYSRPALKRLMTRENLRIVETGKLKLDLFKTDIKKVAGGFLIQTKDTYTLKESDLKVVTKKRPSKEEIESMLFANKVVKHVMSNAVVMAKGRVVTGIGAGQMSRVDSVFIAGHKGGQRIKGSVMASDAFFPFPDALELACGLGVTAIIQPGGSVNDAEVIRKADELEVAMVFTGRRYFRH